jgi:glutathione S-transferase
MVHQYKLNYFNGRGRGEPARLLFAYADVKYEDHRVEDEGPAWDALKPKMPFKQLPALEIDGGKVIIAQSKAIYRYLAKEFNLVPKDHIQAARADMLVDGQEDVATHYGSWFWDQKQELPKKLETEHIAPFLALYEKFLTTNGTGYFVTDSITWADIYLYDVFFNLKNKCPRLFDGHAKLTEFVDKIGNEPKIKAWVDKRPKSDW